MFVAAAFLTQTVCLDDTTVKFEIWDTAGQERFKTITYSFYKQANGVIILFDITNQASFSNVKTWLESIYEHADENIVKVLSASKIDLDDERKVSHEEAQEMARQHKMSYFETSAKEDVGINELMQQLMKDVYENVYANKNKMRDN